MFLSHSLWRKLVATLVAVVGFVLLYEATILDSRYAARQSMLREVSAEPAPGARLKFTASAYCKGTTTASGVMPRTGIAAADPELLPVGSVIQIDSLSPKYDGIYTIMDTGPKVHGRHIDLYMWSCYEALDFGRRWIHVVVLRLGWNPRASTPSLIDKLFRRNEAALPPLPSSPFPPEPPRLPDAPR